MEFLYAVECFMPFQIVGCQDIGAAFQQIDFGRCRGGVLGNHAAVVAVGAQDCRRVFEIKCHDKLAPCHGVEQPPLYQAPFAVAGREILVEHEQVVAEIKVGLARV